VADELWKEEPAGGPPVQTGSHSASTLVRDAPRHRPNALSQFHREPDGRPRSGIGYSGAASPVVSDVWKAVIEK
jgi:hypothetical protein